MKLTRFSTHRGRRSPPVRSLLTACGSDDNTGPAGDARRSASAAGGDACFSGTLNAEGSSAQQNAIDEVIASYTATCADATVNYNPTGSGAGVEQFNAGQVDFAGSDSALKDGRGRGRRGQGALQGNDAWNLPMVVGPIAIAYNLEGVDKLVAHPRRRRRRSSRADQEVERPGDRRAEPGRHAAGAPNQGVLPLRRVRAPPRTSQVPRRRGGGAWTDEPAKTWPGTGEGKEKSVGCRRGRQDAPRTRSPTSSGPTPRTTTSASPRSTTAPARSS